MSKKEVTVIVSSRNRPIYLWACLDALYRLTRYPCRVVLVDMASDDPLVKGVITAFRRRGLLGEVAIMPQNDPAMLVRFILSRLDKLDPYFVYIESDAVILERSDCWLDAMVRIMDEHPKMAMLGSAIDLRDFVELDAAAELEPDMDPLTLRALVKADSPERQQRLDDVQGQPIFYPHNPAGRLMMLRTDAVKEVGLTVDRLLDTQFRAAGYDTAIATSVRHRHLLLLHIFDEPHYDIAARNAYMAGLKEPSLEPTNVGEGRAGTLAGLRRAQD